MFVRLYRPVVGQTLLELPRGQAEAVDCGDGVATAIREVAEETGFALHSAKLVGTVYPDTGLLSDSVHIVVGAVAREDVQQGDPEHDVVWLTPRQIDEMVTSGVIRDGLTLAALALVERLTRAN